MGNDSFIKAIKQGIPQTLPPTKLRSEDYPHAPNRLIRHILSNDDIVLAIKNALRYFPIDWHHELAEEFLKELTTYGRIYMYRFMPDYDMYARPINAYPHNTIQAAGIMLMIQNNLDPQVAKYPQELITYGGNGAVFQNWAQYLLVMQYLSKMKEDQTLVIYSGHPMGLFPSHKFAPRVVVTNGMMIPNYSTKTDWNRFTALGVTSYGQMTAGSYMYIGPQGIVHGTTITLLNAGRRRGLGAHNLSGVLYVTSGLGGMSGAQALAGMITGATTIIGEVDNDAIVQRVNDGYIQAQNVYDDVHMVLDAAVKAKKNKVANCFIFKGNIVALWEAIVEKEIQVELGSDQTSLHNIDDLGYCPIGYTFEEAKVLLEKNKTKFDVEIRKTLKRHVKAINTLSKKGMYFWDYGNAFLKEAGEAGAAVWQNKAKQLYKYPSYVEDIMGPICFDYGFGPFRWVCLSGLQSDLDKTDKIATSVLLEALDKAPEDIRPQIEDNILWIKNAKIQIPVVGSKSRILYADAYGRIQIALAFNKAISEGKIKGPIVLGRDHHDVSGTDSPYRETSNIYDGSRFTADMAVQNFVGDAFRGATWVSLHNGGGVGWGEVINGGFGMVIDGSKKSKKRIKSMLYWDVNNGIARRAWARNHEALIAIQRAMQNNNQLNITLPAIVNTKTERQIKNMLSDDK